MEPETLSADENRFLRPSENMRLAMFGTTEVSMRDVAALTKDLCTIYEDGGGDRDACYGTNEDSRTLFASLLRTDERLKVKYPQKADELSKEVLSWLMQSMRKRYTKEKAISGSGTQEEEQRPEQSDSQQHPQEINMPLHQQRLAKEINSVPVRALDSSPASSSRDPKRRKLPQQQQQPHHRQQSASGTGSAKMPRPFDTNLYALCTSDLDRGPFLLTPEQKGIYCRLMRETLEDQFQQAQQRPEAQLALQVHQIQQAQRQQSDSSRPGFQRGQVQMVVPTGFGRLSPEEQEIYRRLMRETLSGSSHQLQQSQQPVEAQPAVPPYQVRQEQRRQSDIPRVFQRRQAQRLQAKPPTSPKQEESISIEEGTNLLLVANYRIPPAHAREIASAHAASRAKMKVPMTANSLGAALAFLESHWKQRERALQQKLTTDASSVQNGTAVTSSKETTDRTRPQDVPRPDNGSEQASKTQQLSHGGQGGSLDKVVDKTQGTMRSSCVTDSQDPGPVVDLTADDGDRLDEGD